MTEILAQWWALLAACTVIVWAVRNSNIGEYDCVDVEIIENYEQASYRVRGGAYCDNPYYERLSKDVQACG